MVGHDHWTLGGKTKMVEIVMIEMEKSGPVLKIRHFGRNLAPWPQEKDGPLSWPLKSLEGRSVVFEHPTRAWPKRMEYHRKGNALSGKLSGVEAACHEKFRLMLTGTKYKAVVDQIA